MAALGTIYFVDDFTFEDGGTRDKYVAILAVARDGSYIARLLTSKGQRPRQPACHHGDPYPSFFLDTLGGAMEEETWVDLQRLDDLDDRAFDLSITAGQATVHAQLDAITYAALLDCVAQAADTTGLQSAALRNRLGDLGQ